MKIDIECLYCGHRWIELIYSKESLVDKRCPRCKSKELRARDVTSKIDYYHPGFSKPAKKKKAKE